MKSPRPYFAAGFTLLELLIVCSIVMVLASLLLPALGKARQRGQSLVCLKNTRQLAIAWLMYANDNDDRLVYNLGVDNSEPGGGRIPPYSWVNNVMTWELDSDNTNTTLLRESKLAPFLCGETQIFTCPSDRVVSEIQRKAGWQRRVRSYSMNAMVGNAGKLSAGGTNVNNPVYRQFFKFSDFPHPARIFVFLDEHPDSINDGYFVNRAHNREWVDLPASYHNGGAALSFGDGHAEIHRWQFSSTKRPARPDAAELPFPLPEQEQADFNWITDRMSIER